MSFKTVFILSAFASSAAVANVIEPPLVKVPAGEFLMGSDEGQDNEKPVHSVKVKAFYAGKYEVTVKEFRQFIEATGFKRAEDGGDLCWTWNSKEYIKPEKGNWDSEFNAPSEFHPVMCISGVQAQAYVDWLSEQTGKPYRLLSEAEWEYSARANSKGNYFFGESAEQLCDYGNVFDIDGKGALERDFKLKGDFRHAKCRDFAEYTAIVGMYKPNAFGLYDTIGNIAEIVEDCEHKNYLGAPTDGSAWTTGCTLFRGEHKMLVSRGGAYGLLANPFNVRSSFRAHFGADNAEGSSTGEGFRIAMDLVSESSTGVPKSTISFEQDLIKAQQAEKVRRLQAEQ